MCARVCVPVLSVYMPACILCVVRVPVCCACVVLVTMCACACVHLHMCEYAYACVCIIPGAPNIHNNHICHYVDVSNN